MSFTGQYTPLRVLRVKDGELVAAGPVAPPKILDLDEWRSFAEAHPTVYEDAMVVEETVSVREEYPRRTMETWKRLVGFEDPDGEWRIHRVAMDYDRDDFMVFWEDVSRATEPFEFYHSPGEAWRLPHEMIQTDWAEPYVYRVRCNRGEVTVQKVEFSWSVEE